MKKIRVLTVNFSDSRGGAAIAARNQVEIVRKDKQFNVVFIVAEKKLDDNFSKGPTKFQFYYHFTLRVISLFICKLQKSRNAVKHSINLFSSSFVLSKLKCSSFNVVHFHWINNETISLKKILSLLTSNKSKKIIFTLHDDWFFCGSEHCSDLNSIDRYINGYSKNNKDVGWLDIDRYIFLKKIKLKPFLTKSNVIFTAPSNYLVRKAKSSLLLHDSHVICIPNIIDVDVFSPDKLVKRNSFSVPDDAFVILFGAIGGASYLKGSDLLLSALEQLSLLKLKEKITLVTFGGTCSNDHLFGFDVVNLGHIDDKRTLSAIYSLADVAIVPSRLEAFGQVAAESLACETPVIAFNNSGITDIVQHNISGYLVKAFDVDELAEAIVKMMKLSAMEREMMGKNGRNFITEKFSPKVVSKIWLDLYNQDIK